MTAAQEQIGYSLMKAAVVAPVICAIAYLILQIRDGKDADALAVSTLFVTTTSFVIGWPCALALGAIPAIVFGSAVQKRDRSAVFATVLCTTLSGALGVASVWRYFEEPGVTTMTIAGAVAGILSGLYFCYLVQRDAPRGESRRDGES